MHGCAAREETTWTVTDTREPKRIVMLVSEEAHCMHDILGRVAAGELPVRLAAVIGIPGLGLYFAARALNLNATVIPAAARVSVRSLMSLRM